MNEQYAEYLRDEAMPTVWCPGCGNGLIIRALIDAVKALELEKDEVAVIGGIGCSGRTPYFLDFNTMHTTHGRAPAFATGLKMANPELNVILAMGDGDAAGIGGNHLIHACRRNIDLTGIVFNNEIYGLTGGQAAPTTSEGKRTTTTPAGNEEPAFDICELAETAGASFVARTTTFDFQEMSTFMTRALAHEGFSLLEVMTPCPTYFGRLNKRDQPSETLTYVRENTIPVEFGGNGGPVLEEEQDGESDEHPTGVFVEDDRPEYTNVYQQRCEAAQNHA